MLLSRVGKKSKLTAHQTKTSKLTLSCSSVNIFVQENKRKTDTRKPKQKTNPPSKTVVPSIDSTFSASFFERTADFGHVPGVRLQVLDDFSIACAWTVRVLKLLYTQSHLKYYDGNYEDRTCRMCILTSQTGRCGNHHVLYYSGVRISLLP